MSFDTDAQDYIDRVIAVDGFMWPHVQAAVNRFVVGCKADPSPMPGASNWDAAKAGCLLAGAQTLAGALVPLWGADPTSIGFVASDYHPALGLKGDGATKVLYTNRDHAEDPQDNYHQSVYVTAPQSAGITYGYVGGSGGSGRSLIGWRLWNQISSTIVTPSADAMGFHGHSRIESSGYDIRTAGGTMRVGRSSTVPAPYNVMIFQWRGADSRSDARIAFYSIGEAVDLESLDRRVSRYMRDIATSSRRGFPLSRLVN